MKNIFITIFLLLSCTSLMAQNKQEKKLLKSLRKQYGLLYAGYRRNWIDNHSYIDLRTKDRHSMIADTVGHLIIPNSYPPQVKYTDIEYMPSHQRGYGTKHIYGSSIECFYVGNQGCFVAKEESGKYVFYNRKGIKTSEFTGFLDETYRIDAYIIRKTKCSRILERNVLQCKTKRSFLNKFDHHKPVLYLY